MRGNDALALVAVVVGLVSGGGAAMAQCPAVPNLLTNGQTADATQVMANFNALQNCLNTGELVLSSPSQHTIHRSGRRHHHDAEPERDRELQLEPAGDGG
jgi:hypothetical protein